MNQDTLQKYIEGDANQQEKEDIAKWLDADEKHMQAFLLQRKAYDVSLWHAGNIPSHVDKINLAERNEYSKSKRTKLVQEFLKVAAILVIVLGSYHFLLSPILYDSSALTLQSVYSPEGQRTELILSDGTKVWLNAKSSLIFPNQFDKDKRIVELNGEAYFDVSHDEEKKFVVKTNLYDIKVHGTEFNVNAYTNNPHFETALIEGSVEITSNSTDETILLSPNSRVYLENNRLVLDEIASMDHFLWTKGILYFENLKVKELLEKLELYYDVKIEVKDKEILQYQYTGKFWTKDGIEHVLKVLQLRHNFKYIKNNAPSQDGTNTFIIYK